MPTKLEFDATLPALAHQFPLAAALLSAWAHPGCLLGEYHQLDANRIDAQRAEFFDIPRL